MSDMRPSLLPGLLAAAQRNADKGIGDVALFEVSGTYEGDGADAAAPRRRRRAARHGQARRRRAAIGPAMPAPVGVFDAKADAIAVLEACGAPVDRLQIEAGGPAWYHPGRSGTIKLGPKTVLGTFRRIPSEDAGRARRFRARSAGFEVFVDAMPGAEAEADAHQAEARTLAFQAVQARLRLRRRQARSRPAR